GKSPTAATTARAAQAMTTVATAACSPRRTLGSAGRSEPARAAASPIRSSRDGDCGLGWSLGAMGARVTLAIASGWLSRSFLYAFLAGFAGVRTLPHTAAP